jgi:3-methyladenine DNA glycosylase AlkD
MPHDDSTRQAVALVARLRALGSEAHRAGMARSGIDIEHACGVSVADLRALAKGLGKDHALAQALWATGYHEARLLACFIDDPRAVTAAQAQAWIEGVQSWDLCDQASTSLFIRTPLAWPLAVQWAQREEPWVRRAGFAMMAGLAVHDKAASDDAFTDLFPLIENAAGDQRPYVRKAVGWALRSICKRNDALKAAALACARGILEAAYEPSRGARGGEDNVRSARGYDADALSAIQDL